MCSNGNLREMAWKLEMDSRTYTGLLDILKKQTHDQAHHFTGFPLTYSMSFSVTEIVKCLEWKKISKHPKWNSVPQEEYQNCFNKWYEQWKNFN
jgi:hypothetical protein